MKETEFHCPVAGCAFVGTAFLINDHLQSVSDAEHRKYEHQLETAMNDAYDEAEMDWVFENCRILEDKETEK